MKYLWLFTSLILLNPGVQVQAIAQPIDHIHEIETRVVAICSDKPDTKNILGTGFIATKHGLVVTADHVIFNEQKNRPYKNLFCSWPTYPEPLWFRLSIAKRYKQGKKGKDIALLKIIPDNGIKSYPFLEIGNEFEIGDPVLITGFPLVFEKIYHWPLFRKGIIASTRYTYQDSRVVLLDFPAVHGYSGSPVINLRNKKVVGIIKGGSAQRKETDFSVAVVIEKEDLKKWGINK